MNVPLMGTKIINLIEFELHVVSMPIDTYCIFLFRFWTEILVYIYAFENISVSMSFIWPIHYQENDVKIVFRVRIISNFKL